MGLDMYLHKKTYVRNWDYMKKEELHEITIKRDGKIRTDIKPERICEITELVCYWRKFNALHNWFVEKCQDGVDDCKEYYVSRLLLEELLNGLKEIHESNRIDVAKEKLPTQKGFFFGGTEYDEYYYGDVKETIEMFESLLKEEGGDFYYTSSW